MSNKNCTCGDHRKEHHDCTRVMPAPGPVRPVAQDTPTVAGLLPCPCCGVSLVLTGDYNDSDAWNYYAHPGCDPDEDSDCLLGNHQIRTEPDMRTPSPDEAAEWNRRPVAQEQAIVWEGDEARLGDLTARVSKHPTFYSYEIWRGEESINAGGNIDEEIARAACEAAMRVLAGRVEG